MLTATSVACLLRARLVVPQASRYLSALTQDASRAGTPLVVPATRVSPVAVTASTTDAASPPPKLARPKLRATKAVITLTPAAIARLRALMSGPTPQNLRIGVRNKGCAGMQYHLEYVDERGRYDEIVEQDGVRVLVDSKALFSIIGSEMDWVEDRLNAKFSFKNPNVKDACGCGESFTV